MSAVNNLGTDNHPLERSADYDERVLVEAELLDVGDQALIRGLDTAFPILRPGLFLSYCGGNGDGATFSYPRLGHK